MMEIIPIHSAMKYTTFTDVPRQDGEVLLKAVTANGKISGVRGFERAEIVLMVVIFTLSCLYFLSYFNHDMNIWDEGVPLNGALRMFQGDRPIRDFFAYPPGRYLVYYLSMNIGGMHVSAPRIAMAVLSGFYCVLIWLIGRKAGLNKSAVIPWILYLLTPMYYYYRFFSFCLILMAFSLALQFKPLTRAGACASGLLAVVITWFRFELGMTLLVLFPVLLIVQWITKRRQPGMISVLPSIILYAGQLGMVMYAGGSASWQRYVDLCRNAVSGGIDGMALPWPPLFSLDYLLNTPFFFLFQDMLFYVSGAVLILSGLSIVKTKQLHPWRTAITLTGAIGFGLVVWRTGYGNLLRCLPPVSILGVWLVTGKKTFAYARYAVGGFLFAGITVDSLLIHPYTYQSIGVVRSTDGNLTHPRFTARVNASDCVQMSELIGTLEQLKSYGYNTMMTVPFHPLLNFITGLRNTSYYEWLLPGMFSTPLSYETMIEEICRHAPDIFAVNDMPFDDVESRRFSLQYPELMAWILRDYYRWGKAAGFDIYRRKPEDVVSVLDDVTSAVTHARGVNQIVKTHGCGGTADMLIQECGAGIRFDIPVEGNAVFYTVLLCEPSNDPNRIPVWVEISVNDVPADRFELNGDENYVILTVPILDVADEPVRLDLVTRCPSSDSRDSVIWLDPVLLELEFTGLFVDRYCSLP
jgi:hypothetical protein